MLLPVLHQGMVVVGQPSRAPALTSPRTGGPPYGPSHLANGANPAQLSDDEITLCRALGERMARLSLQLAVESNDDKRAMRSEEHTSELQSRGHLVCRLLLEKKKLSKDMVLTVDEVTRKL